MVEIVDLSQDPLTSLNRICSLGIQQERQILGDQSNAMIVTTIRSYGRQNTSKVCSHCRNTGRIIDTC